MKYTVSYAAIPPEDLTDWTSTVSLGLARDSSGVWCTQLTLKWNRHQKNVTQEEVCWWKHHRMSSQPSRNYKRKKKNHRNIFPACFHSLHYLAGFPSCPEAYLHVWSFLSLGFAVMLSAAMCFTGARPHSHILGIPDLLVSESGAWPLLPRNRYGPSSGPAEPLPSILLAELRFTATWLFFNSLLSLPAEVALVPSLIKK